MYKLKIIIKINSSIYCSFLCRSLEVSKANTVRFCRNKLRICRYCKRQVGQFCFYTVVPRKYRPKFPYKNKYNKYQGINKMGKYINLTLSLKNHSQPHSVSNEADDIGQKLCSDAVGRRTVL